MMQLWLRKDIKSLKLLYRMSRDGSPKHTFYPFIGDNKPLLYLIKSDKFGTIGAYTSITIRCDHVEAK